MGDGRIRFIDKSISLSAWRSPVTIRSGGAKPSALTVTDTAPTGTACCVVPGFLKVLRERDTDAAWAHVDGVRRGGVPGDEPRACPGRDQGGPRPARRAGSRGEGARQGSLAAD